jgi:hypothetical protein
LLSAWTDHNIPWTLWDGLLTSRRSSARGWMSWPPEYPQSYGWAAIAPEWNPGQDMAKVLDDAVRAVFDDQPPAGMQLQVREGGAAKVLLGACEGAVMLVVGSRGHGGFAGLLLGSVSANVAEHASCPVFIVHGDQAPPPHGAHDPQACLLQFTQAPLATAHTLVIDGDPARQAGRRYPSQYVP